MKTRNLTASGGLVPVTVPDGEYAGASALLPALPVAIGGARPALVRDVPTAGQHTEGSPGGTRPEMNVLGTRASRPRRWERGRPALDEGGTPSFPEGSEK